jgi:hypothetical protein
MHPHPDPSPFPEGIGLDSDPDFMFTCAQALIRKYFLMQSASTGSDNSATCRRIIYLRDYTALSKGLSPLLPSIHDAVSAGTPTVVVAGISPNIERLDGDDSGQFLDWLEHNEEDIINRLHARHGDVWRQGPSRSLEEIFTATFIDRYHLRQQLYSYGNPS